MNYENPQLRLPDGAAVEGQLAWRSPSNIAIIKYWGKYGVQLPRNPSISFTLEAAYSDFELRYVSKKEPSAAVSLSFDFEEKDKIEAFRVKMVKFLETQLAVFPFLTQLDLHISSKNSFPHSAGIASSASSMSALALCLCSLEAALFGTLEEGAPAFLAKASYLARLASGSACRSLYPTMAVWGETPLVAEASNLYAIGVENAIHPVFKTYHDAILIASRAEKSVSSRMGHGLMENNAYAAPRYEQANVRMAAVLNALKTGDVHQFGQIAEDEAMTLHALMMTSSPWFTLLKPNTLQMIEILRGWREKTNLPAYFTLDAGPNLHLLYPAEIEAEVRTLITESLQPLCADGQVIFDKVGLGPQRL